MEFSKPIEEEHLIFSITSTENGKVVYKNKAYDTFEIAGLLRKIADAMEKEPNGNFLQNKKSE